VNPPVAIPPEIQQFKVIVVRVHDRFGPDVPGRESPPAVIGQNSSNDLAISGHSIHCTSLDIASSNTTILSLLSRHSEIAVESIKKKANPNMLLKQLRYAMKCRRCDNAGRVRLIIGYAIGNDARPDLAIGPLNRRRTDYGIKS